MSSTILIVEDELAIQELITVNLKFAGHETLVATTLDQAEQRIRAELPDAIVLDWMLPDGSGVAFLRRLRAETRTKHTPIIMLTARSAESDKISGLEAGADDYLTKPFSPKELLARIKAVLRRRAPQLTDDIVRIASLQLDPTTHRVSSIGADGLGTMINLGPTEFRLLHFFMTHPERVYTRSQLLNQVWGDHVYLEERTVDVHIRRLRTALGPTGHDHLIQTIRGSGYLLTAQKIA